MNANAIAPQPDPTGRPRFLSTAFGLFNGLRVAAYVPMLAAILSAGQADQHSLFTWLVFAGANSTMAMWLLEHNGGRFDRAVWANTSNALMCAAIALAIAWHRWLAPLV
jgi:hypothetical protein